MHSKSDPSRVRFTGPLTPFASGLAQEFAAVGYADTSATILLQFAAHLSQWLATARSGPADLAEPVIDRFLIDRRSRYTSHYSRQALSPILGGTCGGWVPPRRSCRLPLNCDRETVGAVRHLPVGRACTDSPGRPRLLSLGSTVRRDCLLPWRYRCARRLVGR